MLFYLFRLGIGNLPVYKIKILRVDFSLYINRHNAVIVNKL
ncbi:O-antigen polymerase Wzy domain protein [Escherichia coli DEC12D]|nr:O-antigen polymerase Wzy domain protein [Escherichia coli DEC12D]